MNIFNDLKLINSRGILQLESNPTTGYEWSYKISDENIMDLDSSQYIPKETNDETVGSGGIGETSLLSGSFGIAGGGFTGGNGYYGGGGSINSSSGGGSSYISGHSGCITHSSNLIFTNTKMIDGKGYSWTNQIGNLEQMPTPTGYLYNIGRGHNGSGAATIKKVGIYLTFNSNGGAFNEYLYSDSYEAYETVSIKNPTKYGSTFLGWTRSDTNTFISAGNGTTDITIGNTSMVLTANWQLNS